MPGWLGMPAYYYRDAFCIGLAGSAALLRLQRLVAVASPYWPTMHRALPSFFGQEFNATLPAVSSIAGTLQHGLMLTRIVGAVAAFLSAPDPHPALRLLF